MWIVLQTQLHRLASSLSGYTKEGIFWGCNFNMQFQSMQQALHCCVGTKYILQHHRPLNDKLCYAAFLSSSSSPFSSGFCYMWIRNNKIFVNKRTPLSIFLKNFNFRQKKKINFVFLWSIKWSFCVASTCEAYRIEVSTL